MPAYYPVYLDLNGRHCVVVGGEHEAERKVQGLLEHGARVTLISPEVSIVLQDLAGRGLIEWKRTRVPSRRSGRSVPGCIGES